MRGTFFLRVSMCAALGLTMFGMLLGAQEHEGYARADIEYGLTVYAAQCATCHGENGDSVASVDLRSGRLRRVVSDRELRELIMNGIPGTGMLAFDLDTAEMSGVVAYLRNMNYEIDIVMVGDVTRGRVLFEGKGNCMGCHRVRGQGPRVAPDLTAIGKIRTPSSLRRSLLDPTGTMQPINRPVRIVTASGDRITGRRLNEDTYTVQLIDDQERLRSFDKADLRELTVLTDSPMPSYEDDLSPEELADLLAYLISLKG